MLSSLAKRTVDLTGIEERVAKLKKRSIKADFKKALIRQAIGMIDLTTLEGKDTEGKIIQLCNKANNPLAGSDSPQVAAVCVYPQWVKTAKSQLAGTNIKVASVATYFPSGNIPLQMRLDEVKFAVLQGADEVDMVINRGALLQGNYQAVFEEIKAVKKACGKAKLKVILETGELDNLDQVRKASFIAMEAGGDFIKTSTGKIKPAATPEVTAVMLEAIRDYYMQTGKRIGMKPAGGISNTKTALFYLVLLHETLGEDWITPNLFRFGASSLANDLLMQMLKQEVGNYQNPDYFSLD